jgi:phosphoglycolate phosphatase-like HAD superfamily hydrolase
MFDIDGTLVDSMRVDSHSTRAPCATLGGDVYIDDRRPYVHVTDSGILDEILAQHRFEEPLDELRSAVKRRSSSSCAATSTRGRRYFARSGRHCAAELRAA